MANYNGNSKALEKHRFTTDKPESCTGKINLRVPPSVESKIKAKDNWQDEVRDLLKEYAEAS